MTGASVAADVAGPIAKITVWLQKHAPGMALVGAIGVVAYIVQILEVQAIGVPLIEALVVAILLGMILRNVWTAPAATQPGVRFMGKEVLEFAIVLLGASIYAPDVVRAGPILVVGIVLLVVVGLGASLAIGRAMGLRTKLAILVACGNAICGNSAIAAVAPVIGAEKEDVASAIALTAVVGVALVLALPFTIGLIGVNHYQYGVMAGMTVYAVPQVLAATFPVSADSGAIGTLVKLVRVLMLGPVLIFFSLTQGVAKAAGSLTFGKLVPWFLTGFLLLAVVRSVGLIPVDLANILREAAKWLTVLAMAALGLGVELKAVRQVGRSVAITVAGSIVVLVIISLFLIKGLGIGANLGQ